MSEELKFKYDKNDKVLFVNRDFWTIDSVTVFERAETKSFPAYYVRLESGHITQLPEESLFSDKKDAVKKIVELLKDRKGEYQEVVRYLQGKIDDFQSMRHMGGDVGMKTKPLWHDRAEEPVFVEEYAKYNGEQAYIRIAFLMERPIEHGSETKYTRLETMRVYKDKKYDSDNWKLRIDEEDLVKWCYYDELISDDAQIPDSDGYEVRK